MPMIISEDTVWRDGTTINLTTEVQIANGVTLTVEPGAVVNGNGHEIVVFGTLDAGDSSSEESSHFSNVKFQFGNDYDDPGRILIQNAKIEGGSFLDANGHARYGSFEVYDSTLVGVSGFYIWYPTSESGFWGNSFVHSRGLSIGTRHPVTIENNAFLNPSSAFNGQAAIVSWASYSADDDIRVINNTFYKGPEYVLEVADGYSSASIYADGNFIEAAVGGDAESFVLDSQDSLTRAFDISLGVEVTSANHDTPSINRRPSGFIEIEGDAQEKHILAVNSDFVMDPDGLGEFSYQWLRDGTEVVAATSKTYELTQADVGSYISAVVSYTDKLGQPESVTGFVSGRISNVNDLPTGAVGIVGDIIQGKSLTVDTSKLGDPDGLGEFSYQWLRDGTEVVAATSKTYELTQADVGSELSVSLRYIDGHGTQETKLSLSTAAVKGDLVIAGNGKDNQLLGAAFNDRLDGRGGNDVLKGYGGDDVLLGRGGADEAFGGSGSDVLKGGSGADRLLGQGGRDQLAGSGGKDTLLGGGGDDAITGGGGKDLIHGQKGSDSLTGGAGRDIFAFKRGDGADTITDFELGVDQIQIGRGASSLKRLDFDQIGDDVLVSFRNVGISVQDTTVDDLGVSENFLFV